MQAVKNREHDAEYAKPYYSSAKNNADISNMKQRVNQRRLDQQ